MRNQDLGLYDVAYLEGTAAAVEQVVHEHSVWMLLKACLDGSEDYDHLVDLKRMALNDGCKQMLQRHGE